MRLALQRTPPRARRRAPPAAGPQTRPVKLPPRPLSALGLPHPRTRPRQPALPPCPPLEAHLLQQSLLPRLLPTPVQLLPRTVQILASATPPRRLRAPRHSSGFGTDTL